MQAGKRARRTGWKLRRKRPLGGGRYSNDLGSVGSYTLTAGRLAFKGGPWDGYYGATLAGGRIGLTASATGTFYQMTCDRRGN